MPAKLKLTDKLKAKIIRQLEKGVPVAVLAEEAKISISHLYKLRQELENEKPVDLSATGNEDDLRMRTSDGNCWECGETFKRYIGEDKKTFCCYPCFYAYQKHTFPHRDSERSEYGTDTIEGQAKIKEINLIFFPPLCKNCTSEEEFDRVGGDDWFCSPECEAAFDKLGEDLPKSIKGKVLYRTPETEEEKSLVDFPK